MKPAGLLVLAVAACGCATAPPLLPAPPVVTWEQKLAAVMRLEDACVLRETPPETAPAVPAPVPARPLVAPPPTPPDDLVRLLSDPEGRVRRRAPLAVGRVGLEEGIVPLQSLLSSDPEPEVRSMAAFALGLIGGHQGADALEAALGDSSPAVQGRAAEALAERIHHIFSINLA